MNDEADCILKDLFSLVEDAINIWNDPNVDGDVVVDCIRDLCVLTRGQIKGHVLELCAEYRDQIRSEYLEELKLKCKRIDEPMVLPN